MRRTVVLLAAILIFALHAGAQFNTSDSLPEAPLTPAPTFATSGTPLFALATPPALPSDPLAAGGGGTPQVPTVHGVFPDYYWRIYASYSFFRFYIASRPSITKNLNGIDLGVVYYPHLGWIGLEGQFVGEWGSLYKQSAEFGLGAGGVRFRWSAPREAEVFGHALVGGARFVPQTALGGQGAFAFEVGGGVDLGSHRRRYAVRLEGDLVGSRFFSTYQYSPRFAAGFVFKY